MDTGRKSGGGRVVYTLYDECCELWAGSPAAESIAGSLETSNINLAEEKDGDATNKVTENKLGDDQPSPQSKSHEGSNKSSFEIISVSSEDMLEPLKKMIKEDTSAFMSKLREQRNGRSTKQIFVQEQLLTHIKNESEVRKEELKIEREMVEHLAAAEKKIEELMNNFASSMNQTMLQGFMMMQNLFSQNMQPQTGFQPINSM